MITRKILLLDPSPDDVKFFKDVIKPELPFSAIVIVASKATTAIDLLENNDFNIIIVQIFPTILTNGLSIVARLRNGDFGLVNRSALAIACAPIGFDITISVDAGFDTQLEPIESNDDFQPLLLIMRRYIKKLNKKLALQLEEG